jgi:hypothetical protein
MHGEILYAETFIKIGDRLGNSVDDMSYFVAYDELNVLSGDTDTLAANWSPMNRPSLILTGPNRN